MAFPEMLGCVDVIQKKMIGLLEDGKIGSYCILLLCGFGILHRVFCFFRVFKLFSRPPL